MIAFLSVLGIAPASAAMPDDHDFVVRCCDICTAFGREGILAGSPPLCRTFVQTWFGLGTLVRSCCRLCGAKRHTSLEWRHQ